MTAPELAGALLSLFFCIWCVLLHLWVCIPPAALALPLPAASNNAAKFCYALAVLRWPLCTWHLPEWFCNSSTYSALHSARQRMLAKAGLHTNCSPEPSREQPSDRRVPKAHQLRGRPVECCRYFAEKHWLANNVLGLAFSVQGIEHLSLGAVSTGVILLSGLFFYDIFWVFCTPVMVSVVRSSVCLCMCSLVLYIPQPLSAVRVFVLAALHVCKAQSPWRVS